MRWVKELFEPSQHLHSLVVSALTVDEDEEGAGTVGFRGPPVPVRIQVCDGCGREDGDATLTERTLTGVLLTTCCVNLKIGEIANVMVLSISPSFPFPST